MQCRKFGTLATHVYKGICPWKSKEELAAFLSENILYQKDGIIAVNKPFGVGVLNTVRRREAKRSLEIREGKPDPKTRGEALEQLYHTRGIATTHYVLEDLVPELRVLLGLPELQLVKSPEKFTSGVAIFGATQAVAQKLQLCIRKTKEMKVVPSNYLVVATNIAKIPEEIRMERVGIVLRTNEATGSKQPVIEKDFSLRSMYANVVYPAQVELMLHSSNPSLGVACAEIRTNLTKWNFLRVYSAYSLMPLLGDHLYGARVQSIMGVKVALPPLSLEPGATSQKLSAEVSRALGLGLGTGRAEAEESLIVPLHAHLQAYTISRFFPSKKKQLVIRAPAPQFFGWTCRKLGLKFPE